MDRHAVINQESGEVVNVIAWDGATNWAPPVEHYVMKNEDCARGDVWHKERQEFMRPLKALKQPEDEISVAERKAHYEESKSRLRLNAGFLVLDDRNVAETL